MCSCFALCSIARILRCGVLAAVIQSVNGMPTSSPLLFVRSLCSVIIRGLDKLIPTVVVVVLLIAVTVSVLTIDSTISVFCNVGP